MWSATTLTLHSFSPLPASQQLTTASSMPLRELLRKLKTHLPHSHHETIAGRYRVLKLLGHGAMARVRGSRKGCDRRRQSSAADHAALQRRRCVKLPLLCPPLQVYMVEHVDSGRRFALKETLIRELGQAERCVLGPYLQPCSPAQQA